MSYICISILYWCFSFWPTSLCIIGSSFIHLIRTDSNVFFLMAELYSIVYMYRGFLICSSVDGHLGCYCKRFCDEHWGTRVSFNSGFLGVYASSGFTGSWKWKKVKSLSRVRLLTTPWTEAHQAPPSLGFFRQEYWSGLPSPSPGELSNPGIEPRSPALQADALTSEPPVLVY